MVLIHSNYARDLMMFIGLHFSISRNHKTSILIIYRQIRKRRLKKIKIYKKREEGELLFLVILEFDSGILPA